MSGPLGILLAPRTLALAASAGRPPPAAPPRSPRWASRRPMPGAEKARARPVRRDGLAREPGEPWQTLR
ncbi:hypothetical protein Q6324_28520, partial [Klebsiella pneumoniae]|nr:hypothetical protein [Klebsiella pneumoniae]